MVGYVINLVVVVVVGCLSVVGWLFSVVGCYSSVDVLIGLPYISISY